MTPTDAPTVFVVDDDEGVRASIEGLLKSVGLRSSASVRRRTFCPVTGRTPKFRWSGLQ